MVFASGTSFSCPKCRDPGEATEDLKPLGIVRLKASAPPNIGLQRGDGRSCRAVKRGALKATEPPKGYLGVTRSQALLMFISSLTVLSKFDGSSSAKVVRALSNSLGTARLTRPVLGGACIRAEKRGSPVSCRGERAKQGRRAGVVLDRQQLVGAGTGASAFLTQSDFSAVLAQSFKGSLQGTLRDIKSWSRNVHTAPPFPGDDGKELS